MRIGCTGLRLLLETGLNNPEGKVAIVGEGAGSGNTRCSSDTGEI